MRGVLRVAPIAGASCRSWRRNPPCLLPFRNCVIAGILIILGAREGVIGVSEDSVLRVVLVEGLGHVAGDEEIFVLFGEVGFGHGPPFALIFAMNPFLEPVGDECA